MPEKSKLNSPKKQSKESSSAALINSNNASNNITRKGKTPLLKLLKISLILLVFSMFVVGSGALSIVYSYVKDSPEINSGSLQSSVTSYIYDRNEVVLAELYDEQNRIEISMETIPEHVKNAFIAIEDERFFEHYGVDLQAITRAFVINLRKGDWTVQGGSTITQQLIKNAFLTPEKTFRRKVQEAWLSIKMESQYSKNEILEIYLNQIYFAHGAYGIEAAANVYFNKSVKELTIAEASMLAGIPRSPNYYSPKKNPEAARQRQYLVLSKMHELGFISSSELHEARNTELYFAEPVSKEYPYPYFVDYVLHHELIDILTSMPGYDSREEAYNVIYNAGLRVYTTLDTEAQQTTEDIINDESLYPQQTVRVDMNNMKQLISKSDYSSYPEEVIVEYGVPQPQSAAVVANPVTGEILALVGGREYSQYNQDLRFLSRRQPGSAIKPIFAYAPAMEENLITPGSPVDDAPFVRGNWEPENFDQRFRGLVTIREALVRSLNVPAIKTFAQISPEIGLKYAERMGISTIHPHDYNLASAIGGMTYGVTAFDMAQAFGVLANEGIKTKLHTVQRIEDASGVIIYEYGNEQIEVLSPQTAYLVTDMLKDVVRNGTASRLKVGRPVAAKTGTTSDNRDAYLVAYTPDMVVSFWMGHDLQKLGMIQGGSGATIVFMNHLITQLKGDDSPVDFERPSDISEPVSICSKSGLRPSENCPSGTIVSEIFPTHLLPQKKCNLHVKTEVCAVSGLLPGEFCPEHEIINIYYLNRPVYEITNHRWKGGAGRGPEDAGLTPPKQTCNVHAKPLPTPSGFSGYLFYSPLKVHLRWNMDPAITEYHIYRKASGEEDFVYLNTLNGSEYQFLDVDLAEGKEYTYRLFAFNEEGVQSEPAVWSMEFPEVKDTGGDSSLEKPQPPDEEEKPPEHPDGGDAEDIVEEGRL